MLSGSPTGHSRGAKRDTQLILEALRRVESRIVGKLRTETVPAVGGPQLVNSVLESAGDRFDALNLRISSLPATLLGQRREVMLQFASQLHDLRQDLRAFTLMMGIAIVLIILLLVVLLFLPT